MCGGKAGLEGSWSVGGECLRGAGRGGRGLGAGAWRPGEGMEVTQACFWRELADFLTNWMENRLR